MISKHHTPYLTVRQALAEMLHLWYSGPQQPSEVRAVIDILLARELERGEAKQRAQGHTECRWSQDSSPRSLVPEPMTKLLCHTHPH